MGVCMFKYVTKDCKHIDCDLVYIESNLIDAIWCRNGKIIPLNAVGKIYCDTRNKTFYMYSFTRDLDKFLSGLYEILNRETVYTRKKLNDLESKTATIKNKLLERGYFEAIKEEERLKRKKKNEH